MSEKSGLITFSEFREFMFSNIVPLEDITDFKEEPIAKMLPFWRKNELVPFIAKGAHIKISFAELIWLRILDMLRQFAYPITHTKKVCDYFFKDAYDDGLPEKNMRHNRKMLHAKKQAGTLTEEDNTTLDYLEEYLADEVLLHILKSDINYLTVLVTECITEGEERGILIFNDGRVAETNGLGTITHGKYKIDRSEPHIYLSIPYFLKEFIESDQLSSVFIPQLLNDDERKVLREIKNRNVREISVTLKDGKISHVKSTREGMLSDSQTREIKRILGLKNYEAITIDTLSESKFSFKKTKKKL